MNYYGYATNKDIRLMIGEIVTFFDGDLRDGDHYNQKYLNAYNLLLETACAETQLGTFPDYTNENGFGICQFEEPGITRAKKQGLKLQDEIFNQWGINIDLLQLIELRYNPFLSFLCCRLFYKDIPDPIPSTREERATYWKKWYNTYKGSGSVKHYLASCEEILGKE